MLIYIWYFLVVFFLFGYLELIESFPYLPADNVWSDGQVVQFETSSCILDGKGNYEEYHESYLKIDGGSKIEKFMCKQKLLDHNYGSFNGLKEQKNNSQEKTLKSNLSRLLPTVSFNDKTLNSPTSQKRKSAVYRLSFKRRSCDGEEVTEHSKFSSYQ